MGSDIKLTVLSSREASIFAAFSEAAVVPSGSFPPVIETIAVTGFDSWLENAPAVNRIAFRALLYLIELGSIPAGFGRRMRRLSREGRKEYITRLETTPFADLVKTLGAAARFVYYADPKVMLMLGYDSEAVVARGKALREKEGRW